MKKNLLFLSSFLTIGVLLTACGTPDTAVEEDTGTTSEEDTNDNVPTEEAAEETTDTSDSSEEAEPAGTLTQSEEQNYELYVLDGYDLTAEEPKKDALYAIDNSAVFMRIEAFAPGEVDFAAAEENMKQTLQAVNPDEEPTEVMDFDRAVFEQVTAYEVPSTEGTVTGIVFEKEDLLVRLTLFDDSTVNATEDFIVMGSSIEHLEQ
ncbi:hypothetical protein A1A1_15283 [Planococcus antarcticus DSM 14505]|uniref:DUF5067 domain-containing protein n=1 Tax=Planococcus antarcticus DSM 14505 TaxID=1185653 RepID=A0A1C7DG54_9BACL|nr:hypothetical protein [Planococcus antarcticus]ANU10387.1 hypothetical protein BBH88_08765 [Planococcus antarcticus DSM 14505]EIM05603.1 hypothetical protein A1A1_15283 [Planococcus antarcticus DSM 14505]